MDASAFRNGGRRRSFHAPVARPAAIALATALLAAFLGLGLAGCQEPLSGPIENAPNREVTLAPIPEGRDTPTYTVDADHGWTLDSPTFGNDPQEPHEGSALVRFPNLTVELTMQGGRLRLRCRRPNGVTAPSMLLVDTFSAETLGDLDLDQEITIDGFPDHRCQVRFDLGPITLPPTEKIVAPKPKSAPIGPRMLLGPATRLQILNHSERSVQWADSRGRPVLVPAQDRASIELVDSLEKLHQTSLGPRLMVPGRLYWAGTGTLPASGAGLYFAHGSDDQLIILAIADDKPVSVELGEQNRLVFAPPGGRCRISGRWTLRLTSHGHWRVEPALTAQGALPVLKNTGDTLVHWTDMVSLSDRAIPPHTWRRLDPLP
ncbi:MAG: hypothetical protein ACREJ2_09300 [Planctomycetota bacterium]